MSVDLRISVDKHVRPFLDVMGSSSVDVDAPMVETVLLGLQRDPTKPIEFPLDIIITPSHNGLQTGLATAVMDTQGGVEHAFVLLPLFEYRGSKDTRKLSYDSNSVNSTLIHELQHVADFNDHELLNERQRHYKKSEQLIKKARTKAILLDMIILSAIAGADGYELASGDSKDILPTSMMGLSAYLLGKYLTNSHRAQLARDLYKTNPLEIRAHNISKEYRENTIPQMVHISNRPVM